jgi:hypothetical protein
VAAGATSPVTPLLIDPFVGSGNTLYWLAHHLSVERGIGFELDPSVFALTRANLATLGLPLDVFNSDYRAGLLNIDPAENQLVVAFVAPPWGDALSPVSGLDLRQTYPPISEIIECLATRFGQNRILFVVQVYEALNHDSLTELTTTFDWWTLKLYDLNAAGQNHGVLLGTVRWKPPTQSAL